MAIIRYIKSFFTPNRFIWIYETETNYYAIDRDDQVHVIRKEAKNV